MAKKKLTNILEEGLDNEYISKTEFEAMCTEGKMEGKFYCNFKVHKEHIHGQPPPVRPICSGNGSIIENPGAFVEFHISDIAKKHDTYLEDTPDFLRKIESEIKKGERLPSNSILVTLDVKSLFTNFAHKEGIKCTREA